MKTVTLSLLVAGWLLAGCGGGDGAGSTSETGARLPAVTAPQLSAPTRSQKDVPPTAAGQGHDSAPATSTGSTGAGSGGQASRPGGSKSANQTLTQRGRQRNCEKKAARLPDEQQRQALAQCLNPTPPAPEVQQTTEAR